MRYAKPKSTDEALALLAEGRWRLLAGGTDFYPAQGTRPILEDILDLNGLSDLRHVSETETHFVFGARASWTDIIRAKLPAAFDALKLAAREVGSVQIQNAGTIAGNLCNASPAADGVPPLLSLDAEVELRSSDRARVLPLGDFILGNRRTALGPGEMLTAVRVPKRSAAGHSHFVKLGARRYLVISIAMAAARIVTDEDGRIEEAAIAVGSCSAVAVRLTALEAALRGEVEGGALHHLINAHDFDELSPIDDVRATAEYRLNAAREIVWRGIAGALASCASVKEGVAA
jgi:CO/xanthine dehydrogenase FAD-binding subunit